MNKLSLNRKLMAVVSALALLGSMQVQAEQQDVNQAITKVVAEQSEKLMAQVSARLQRSIEQQLSQVHKQQVILLLAKQNSQQQLITKQHTTDEE